MTPHEKAEITYKKLQERKKKKLRDINTYCCDLTLRNTAKTNKKKYGKKACKQV